MTEDSQHQSETDGFFSGSTRLCPKLIAPGQNPDDETYKMDHKNRGIALIFNHESFDHPLLGERKGTEKDSEALANVLRTLRFDVQTYKDLNKNQIFETLDNVAKSDHSNNDCLVIAVMSHGKSNGRLYSKDSDYYADALVNRFSASYCPTLAGKPKIFFIQACRGEKTDSGIKMVVKSDSESNTIYSIPVMADILIMYSTVEGYYAWRDPKKGSWFIQSLVEQLEKHYKTKDLLSILTLVNRQVAIGYVSVSLNPDFHEKKEMCSIVSMLTRAINFD